MFPDFSEYLKRPGKFDIEERDWLANPGKNDWHAKIVNEFVEKNKIQSIIEIGCGSGETARRLKGFRRYIGIDSNEECLEYARGKTDHARYVFINRDIRALEAPSKIDDLVICFSTMKHFGLHEWFGVFKKISSFGKYFIFDIPVAETTKDDGKDFHHVWKSWEELREEIIKAGLTVVSRHDSFNPLEPVFICKRK